MTKIQFFLEKGKECANLPMCQFNNMPMCQYYNVPIAAKRRFRLQNKSINYQLNNKIQNWLSRID